MIALANTPVIETQNLILRAPQYGDWEVWHPFAESDRAQYIDRLDRRTAWRTFASELGNWPLFGFGPFHLERKSDGAILGNVGVLNHDHFPEVEIGWIMYDGSEGQGYAAEAATAVRDWAFGPRGLSTLVSYIDPENSRSIALAERLGARLDPDAEGEDEGDLVYRHPNPFGSDNDGSPAAYA